MIAGPHPKLLCSGRWPLPEDVSLPGRSTRHPRPDLPLNSACAVCSYRYSTHWAGGACAWRLLYRMASASSRFLPHFVGIIVIALLGLGCLERAKGTARSEPTLSKQAIVTLAAQSLTASGMPEPPLRNESTRAERKEYLAATQGALEQLRKVGSAKSEQRDPSARLLLDDRTEQILAVSRLLAVELADSIDRSDARRALAA